MARPADKKKEPRFKAAYLIKYDLPPNITDDVSDILEMVERDSAFAQTLEDDARIGNVFFAQTNIFYHQKYPPEKWLWSNTSFHTCEYIVTSLLNHGRVAIMQKDRFRQNFALIGSKAQRFHALNECNAKLEHASLALEAFVDLDERLRMLREEVDEASLAEVDLDCNVHLVDEDEKANGTDPEKAQSKLSTMNSKRALGDDEDGKPAAAAQKRPCSVSSKKTFTEKSPLENLLGKFTIVHHHECSEPCVNTCHIVFGTGNGRNGTRFTVACDHTFEGPSAK